MTQRMKGNRKPIESVNLLALIAAAVSTGVLSGCGMGTIGSTKPVPVAVPAIKGIVKGGQQPVAGVTLQLYTAATSYGGAATPLGSSFATTPSGNFTLPAYTCADPNSQIFLLGTGGTPIGGSPNPNLALMLGIGNCNTTLTFLNVNELSTVATVWALSGFMSGPTNVGAPASNALGLSNAFAAINKVVNVATGTASGPELPAGATLPISEINALGNILQNCINSAGGSASDTTDGLTDGTPCGKLFFLTTTSSAPTDTISAALNIAQHPGVNVAYLNDLQASSPAFFPSLDVNAPPTDWTIAIGYIGGGLSNPQALATDASGNVWVTNAGTNSVTLLNNTGAASSGADGFTAGGINSPYGIAIDTSGNAWVANSGNNTLTQLAPSGGALMSVSGGGLSTPKGVAIDGAGNVWVTNNGDSSISGFTSSGTPLAGSPYTGGGLNSPTSIAINPK